MAMEQATTTVELNETNDTSVDAGAAGGLPMISDEKRAEIMMEIEKLDDEISTLKQALARKERQLAELRAQVGITRWSRLQNSEAVNKSKQVISDAGQKTTQVLKDLGTATANKWTEIKESPRMQTVSEKFWSTTGAVKNRFLIGRFAVKRAITDGLGL